MVEVPDWAVGDALGLRFPARAEALRAGGAAFLTEAFRAAGALTEDESVAEIRDIRERLGGSTGRKLRLKVRYAGTAQALPEDLFIKFSRDPDDAIRDRARIQMESEVGIALMSRLAAFPVPVPRCMFADFERATGTGILITEEIAFGRDGIEPHREKGLDTELADPLDHYRALMRANARLGGVHRAGGFPEAATAPFRAAGVLGVSDRQPYSAEQLSRRIDRLREFAAAYPQLLPPAIRSEAFLDRFAREATRFCGHEAAIADHLAHAARYGALCHWNANIDNAWFWREPDGALRCGLMDWGNSRVMNIGIALAGSLMAAEPEFLVAHLDELLRCYVDAFAAECGEVLDLGELRDHMFLQIASSGLLWLIDAPAMILRNCPDLAAAKSRFDPRLQRDELLRNQLLMLTVFLSLWDAFAFGEVLDRYLATRAG